MEEQIESPQFAIYCSSAARLIAFRNGYIVRQSCSPVHPMLDELAPNQLRRVTIELYAAFGLKLLSKSNGFAPVRQES
jgi:hypothetical protein